MWHGVVDVARKLPDAVCKLVSERARAMNTTEPTPKLRVLASAPKTKEPMAETAEKPPPAREVQTLSAQFAQAVADRKQERQRMKPIRDDMKHAERALMTHLNEEGVQVQMEKSNGKKPRKLRIFRERKVTKRATNFGIRNICSILKEVVPGIPRNDHFDDALWAELKARLVSE